MNKRQAQFYDSYVNSTASHLDHVYKSYSVKKRVAFQKCVDKRQDDLYQYGCVGSLRIISHNSDFFSVAWTVETKEALFLHVITPSNDYFFGVACYV